MVQIVSRILNSEDYKILAKITKSARKDTPVESEETLEEIQQNIEELCTDEKFRKMIAFNEAENIVGWIYYYVGFPLMAFISGFQPILDKTDEADEIALALIEAAKKDIVQHGFSRLEIELVFPTKAHRTYSERFVDLYRKCGFKFAAEEVHMKTDLTILELPKIDLPQGYVLRKFSEVSYNQLEGPGFQSLKDSMEGLFLSMSHAEQKVTLDYFFDKSTNYIEDASLILEREGEVIGFIITRLREDEPEIGPIGLVPEARGQGLASYLLVRVLENLKNIGSTSVYLDTTITNLPAQKLYRRYGFKDVYNKQFYYWSP